MSQELIVKQVINYLNSELKAMPNEKVITISLPRNYLENLITIAESNVKNI